MNNLVNAIRASGTKDYKGLGQRYRQLFTLPPDKFYGHKTQFEQRQGELRNKLKEYKDEGCPPPPAILTEWADKQAPDSPRSAPNSPININPPTPAQTITTITIISIIPIIIGRWITE